MALDAGGASGAGGDFGTGGADKTSSLTGFENPLEEIQKSIDNAQKWQGRMSTRGHVLRGAVR